MMEALIAELESAEKGSRELDVKIGMALGKTPEWYSESLDAALTLVPEGRASAILIYESGRASAAIGEPPQFGDHEAPTPALALCIAALRARQAMEAA